MCLTVTGIYDNTFTADVMHETLNRSSLGKLVSGSAVNLERAMAADGRFGGHIVSGHIDGTGKVAAITKDDNAIWYQIKTDSGILKYIVEKSLNKGCKILITNAHHKSLIDLYKGLGEMICLSRSSVLASDSKKRGVYEELVIKLSLIHISEPTRRS